MSTDNTPLSQFGPGVIGEEAHAVNQKRVKELRHVFGPGVVGEEAAEPVEIPAPETGKGLDLSIAKIQEQLGLNPSLFEEFFLGEMQRPLPRKGAMRILLDHQLALNPGVQKPEVIALLEERLKPTAT